MQQNQVHEALKIWKVLKLTSNLFDSKQQKPAETTIPPKKKKKLSNSQFFHQKKGMFFSYIYINNDFFFPPASFEVQTHHLSTQILLVNRSLHNAQLCSKSTQHRVFGIIQMHFLGIQKWIRNGFFGSREKAEEAEWWEVEQDRNVCIYSYIMYRLSIFAS